MVTTVVNNPGIVVGQLLDTIGAEVFSVIKGVGAIVRGDVLIIDQSASPVKAVKKTAAAGLLGPFVMAMEDKTSSATSISIVSGGVWALLAAGAHKPGAELGLSATVDGRIDNLTRTTSGLDTRMMVGISRGFADNYKRGTDLVTVAGDLVAVNANAGYKY